jgi:hypothetical protein
MAASDLDGKKLKPRAEPEAGGRLPPRGGLARHGHDGRSALRASRKTQLPGWRNLARGQRHRPSAEILQADDFIDLVFTRSVCRGIPSSTFYEVDLTALVLK